MKKIIEAQQEPLQNAINYNNLDVKLNIDGSAFYDIAVFKAKEKKKFEILKESLLCKGFIQS